MAPNLLQKLSIDSVRSRGMLGVLLLCKVAAGAVLVALLLEGVGGSLYWDPLAEGLFAFDCKSKKRGETTAVES